MCEENVLDESYDNSNCILLNHNIKLFMYIVVLITETTLYEF